jgi:hypothetical protein
MILLRLSLRSFRMSGFRMGSNWELCRFSEALFFFSRDIVFRMSSTQSVSWRDRRVRAILFSNELPVEYPPPNHCSGKKDKGERVEFFSRDIVFRMSSTQSVS